MLISSSEYEARIAAGDITNPIAINRILKPMVGGDMDLEAKIFIG